jgi:DNA-binding winged helix-turn-helix (wHTH) protein
MSDERPFPEPHTPWGKRFVAVELAFQDDRRRQGLSYFWLTQEQLNYYEAMAVGLGMAGLKRFGGVRIDGEASYLRVTFDDARLLICRINYKSVEVRSKPSWALARILVEGEDRFTSPDTLYNAWGECGADPNMLNKELSSLRTHMHKLGIDIENAYGHGWRLVEASIDPRINQIKKKNRVRKK